jgi:hypothetical protein
MLRIPHCLDSWLTVGGEVVNPSRRQPFTLSKIPGTNFCWRLSKPQGLVRLEGLGELKNSMILSGVDLATFRLVAQGKALGSEQVEGLCYGLQCCQGLYFA